MVLLQISSFFLFCYFSLFTPAVFTRKASPHSLDERDGVGAKNVVHEGVGEVLGPARDGTLPRDVVLEPESNKGDHGEPAVLDLLQLELVQHGPSVLLGPPEEVEDSARVPGLVALRQRVALEDGILVHAALLLHVLVPPDLHPVHQKQLDHEVDLGVRVVLEGGGLDEVNPGAGPLDTKLGGGLGCENSETPEHGKTGVQELGLGKPLELVGLRA
mmetsp:Transcript_4661/g.16349  ORF Transcript_4661/g.16349 Transcript_4661/m.16349 type:complete len:216 (-) Transcript_4661:352-999(-)